MMKMNKAGKIFKILKKIQKINKIKKNNKYKKKFHKSNLYREKHLKEINRLIHKLLLKIENRNIKNGLICRFKELNQYQINFKKRIKIS